MLQTMGLQTVKHNLAAKQQQQNMKIVLFNLNLKL